MKKLMLAIIVVAQLSNMQASQRKDADALARSVKMSGTAQDCAWNHENGIFGPSVQSTQKLKKNNFTVDHDKKDTEQKTFVVAVAAQSKAHQKKNKKKGFGGRELSSWKIAQKNQRDRKFSGKRK